MAALRSESVKDYRYDYPGGQARIAMRSAIESLLAENELLVTELERREGPEEVRRILTPLADLPGPQLPFSPVVPLKMTCPFCHAKPMQEELRRILAERTMEYRSLTCRGCGAKVETNRPLTELPDPPPRLAQPATRRQRG